MKDIAGKRFGRLVALRPTGQTQCSHYLWLCRCDCGTEVSVLATNLIQGRSTSCGCYRKEWAAAAHYRHGMVYGPEHRAWTQMLARVRRPSCPGYLGDRISVCDEWTDFRNFYADMGDRPTDKHCLTRDDLDGDFTPLNCSWGLRSEYMARVARERWRRR